MGLWDYYRIFVKNTYNILQFPRFFVGKPYLLNQFKNITYYIIYLSYMLSYYTISDLLYAFYYDLGDAVVKIPNFSIFLVLDPWNLPEVSASVS